MTEAWYYNPADHYVLDDISGFKVRRSRTRTIPGGQTGQAVVDRKRWEPQQPQDFVRGVVDDQTVDVARPRQQNQFMMVGTFITQAASVGAFAIVVDSAVGMTAGDTLQIMLDSGINFTAQITSIEGSTIALATPLPASVGTLGDPAQNMVLDLTAPQAPLNWIGPGAA
ncbi:conserved hypothetical protein [Gluconacetobacter diazotrophicus PA1 5]|uniref:hypothetical protein n=1 Tax=Gluconacetobacter diazotrophicus TaxID=33996 RepID=UPI000173D8D2|nr:hypothetical protein [Gluconacetobacter diazotrophicus]ACI52200.1 conserved hypothetical protein [Gluconacetobacter diazotrophicus PA1 5]TWB00429.1 hypothetical protein FBZ86_1369 [Gluconacetobacter diazotrophicus]